MQDPTVAAVLETDSEVEAMIYHGVLTEEGIPAQVRTVEDPILTNIIRQIALPRYQVVVPPGEAERAASVIAAQREAVAASAIPSEEEPREESPMRRTVLLIGRALIWLLIITLAVVTLVALWSR